jgi:hypothetical protein
MKPLSAIVFGLSTSVCGAIAEIWRIEVAHDRPAELGMTVALIGLLLFGILFASLIYCSGLVLRYVHRDRNLVAAYAISALLGAPFWSVLLSSHSVVRDRLHLPDILWLVEALVLCGIAFEIIRLADRAGRRLTTRSSQPLPGE